MEWILRGRRSIPIGMDEVEAVAAKPSSLDAFVRKPALAMAGSEIKAVPERHGGELWNPFRADAPPAAESL